MPEFVSDKKLFLNADKSAVVDEDSPDAAFVLVGEGGTVSHEDAERYGLTAPSNARAATRTAAEHEAAAADEQRHDGSPGASVGIDDDEAKRIRAGESMTQIEADRQAALDATAGAESGKSAPTNAQASSAPSTNDDAADDDDSAENGGQRKGGRAAQNKAVKGPPEDK
jgi:hypothetical protein